MRANLVGVSLATAPGRACYIPLQHKASGGGLFGGELVEGLEDDAAGIHGAALPPLERGRRRQGAVDHGGDGRGRGLGAGGGAE